MTQERVVVVGGGVTGVGIARDLAMRGVDVTLFERGEGLNAGTSGRSHGVLHSGARYAESDPEGAAECLRENRVLREIAAGCVADTGGLFLQLDGDEPAYFEEKAATCREVGIEVERLDAEAVQDHAPAVSDTVVRGFAVPDGVVYPSRLVAATAADAADRGAEIVTGAPVECIDTAGAGDDESATVHVGGDEPRAVEASAVVNAAGPWAGQVAGVAGAELAMRPTRGVMVAVEHSGLGPVLNRCRAPADGDIVVPHGDSAVLGTTSVAVDDPDSFEREDWEVTRTVEECAAMVPSLADAAVERTYWGLRPLYEPDETEGSRGISRDFAVIDHDEAPALVSVVGGKLTTHRLMAEAAVDHVCDSLGVGAACRTAEEPLTGAGDPEQLDEFVERFHAAGPADSDIVD